MNYECDVAMFDDDMQRLYYYHTDILSYNTMFFIYNMLHYYLKFKMICSILFLSNLTLICLGNYFIKTN